MKASGFIRLALLTAVLAPAIACVGPGYPAIVYPHDGVGAQQPWQSNGRYRTEPGAPTGGAPQGTVPYGAQPAYPGAGVPEQQLYSWDGGVVDARPQGKVMEEDGARGVEPTNTGRMHIIELYQAVLDERDALAEDVEALTAALEQAQRTIEEERKKSKQLEGQLATLQSGQEQLFSQQQEMAARLTTAQIRRLEAEKLLLETRIAEHSTRSQPSVGSKDG